MSGEENLPALLRQPFGTPVDIGEATKSFNQRIEQIEKSLSAIPWKVECTLWKATEFALAFQRGDRGWALKHIKPRNPNLFDTVAENLAAVAGESRGQPVSITLLRDASIEAKVQAIELLPLLIREMRRSYLRRRRLLNRGNKLLDELDQAINEALDDQEGES